MAGRRPTPLTLVHGKRERFKKIVRPLEGHELKRLGRDCACQKVKKKNNQKRGQQAHTPLEKKVGV